MEIYQLRYFMETARVLHFAMAAETLKVTQPALSRGIRSLEHDLGMLLIDRSNKHKISLTAAGEAFLPEVERILKDLARARSAAEEARSGRQGHLSVGALSSTLGKKECIDSIITMRKRFPGITLEVIEDNSKALADSIKDRTLDLILTRRTPELFDDETLLHEEIYQDRLVVVFSVNHPLAKKKKIRLKDLRSEKIILVPKVSSPVFNEYVRNLCETQGGFIPQVTEECSSSYTAMHLAAAGMGISFVSSTYRGLFQDMVSCRELSDCAAQLPVYMVRSADRSRNVIIENFCSILRKAFRNHDAR